MKMKENERSGGTEYAKNRRRLGRPIHQNDANTHPETHRHTGRAHGGKHAGEFHLQSGRHLFRWPAEKQQRHRRGGRGVQPDGHSSGLRLYGGHGLGQRHQPPAGPAGRQAGQPHRLHGLFHLAGLRPGAGRERPCLSGAADAASGRHRHHSALRLRLRALHSGGRAADVRQLHHEQYAALRGQGRLCHDRPDHRRHSEHPAGPAVHLCVRHGHRRRGAGHGPVPVRELLPFAGDVPLGQKPASSFGAAHRAGRRRPAQHSGLRAAQLCPAGTGQRGHRPAELAGGPVRR